MGAEYEHADVSRIVILWVVAKITDLVSTMTFEIFNPNSLEMFRLTSEDSGVIRQASHPVG